MRETPPTEAPTPFTRRGSPALHYVEQRSSDLAFYLFDSAAPRGLVQVLSERTLRLPGGRVTLAVIGSSHFLEIGAADTTLCELLACPRPGLEALPRGAERGGEQPCRYGLHREELTYDFELWRGDYSPQRFERESDRLSKARPRRLQYSFPGGEASGSALTCLEWQVEGRRVTVATYHTFPGELSIVHTRSVIDFAGAGEQP